MSLRAFAADVREVLAYEDRVAAMSPRGREALRLPGRGDWMAPAALVVLACLEFSGFGLPQGWVIFLLGGIAWFSVSSRTLVPRVRGVAFDRHHAPSGPSVMAARWFRRGPLLLWTGIGIAAFAAAHRRPESAGGLALAAGLAGTVALPFLLAAGGAWAEHEDLRLGGDVRRHVLVPLCLAALTGAIGACFGGIPLSNPGVPASTVAVGALVGATVFASPLLLLAWLNLRTIPALRHLRGLASILRSFAVLWCVTAAVAVDVVLVFDLAGSTRLDGSSRAAFLAITVVTTAGLVVGQWRAVRAGVAAPEPVPAGPGRPRGASAASRRRIAPRPLRLVAPGGGLRAAAPRLWLGRQGSGIAAITRVGGHLLAWALLPALAHGVAMAMAMAHLSAESDGWQGPVWILLFAIVVGRMTPRPLSMASTEFLLMRGLGPAEVERGNVRRALLLGALPVSAGALSALWWAGREGMRGGSLYLAAAACTGAALAAASGARGRAWLTDALLWDSGRRATAVRWIAIGLALTTVALPDEVGPAIAALSVLAAGVLSVREALRRAPREAGSAAVVAP